MNDLISRQAAIETLNDGAELLNRVLDETDVVGVERTKYEWGLGLIESCISDMKELPSVDIDLSDYSDRLWRNAYEQGKADAEAERKRGKWIRLDMHAHLADHKCTACGQECYVPTCMGEPMYAFCPNCGAKMEE